MDIYSLEHDVDDMFLILSDYNIDNRVDRNVLNTTIISELGAARPITTDPDLFKMLLDNFFNQYSGNITKLVDTMYLEYSPLNNKDMHRIVGENEHRYSKGDIDNTDNYDNRHGGKVTEEEQVSAYDSNEYQPKDKKITSPEDTLHHEAKTTSDIESTVDSDKGIDEHIYGKDSQPSYQTLIEQERKIAEFNIYNWIIKRMRQELFLLVY